MEHLYDLLSNGYLNTNGAATHVGSKVSENIFLIKTCFIVFLVGSLERNKGIPIHFNGECFFFSHKRGVRIN